MPTVERLTHDDGMSTNRTNIHSYREQLRKSFAEGREASILVGSGALRQCGAGIYADWTTILRCTADFLKVDCNPELASSHPTVAWEVIVRLAAKATGTQANQREREARAFVGNLMEECERQVQMNQKSTAALSLGTFIQRRNPRSIITLNFTPVPFCSEAAAPVSVDHLVEYSSHDRPVWCLHGSRVDPDGLRLGVVRYSALISDFAEWRNQYSCLRSGELILDPNRAGVEPVHRFVSDVMESPLLIVGCGLSHAEWTLWWLLASKARNEARHETCPSAIVTADPVNESQRLALEGLHCKIIQASCHEETWSILEFLMER
jgi:hypothetical protein